jgi:hypothetical protein
MAKSTETNPKWRCTDCGRVFDTRGQHPGLEHIDDKKDVFSRQAGSQPQNLCPDCGGLLQPLDD